MVVSSMAAEASHSSAPLHHGASCAPTGRDHRLSPAENRSAHPARAGASARSLSGAAGLRAPAAELTEEPAGPGVLEEAHHRVRDDN